MVACDSRAAALIVHRQKKKVATDKSGEIGTVARNLRAHRGDEPLSQPDPRGLRMKRSDVFDKKEAAADNARALAGQRGATRGRCTNETFEGTAAQVTNDEKIYVAPARWL